MAQREWLLGIKMETSNEVIVVSFGFGFFTIVFFW